MISDVTSDVMTPSSPSSTKLEPAVRRGPSLQLQLRWSAVAVVVVEMILNVPQRICLCYLQRCGLPVRRSDEDHQHVVDAQVAKDVTLRHRYVQTQDLQHVLNRDGTVPVQLKTHKHTSKV